jgi:predicted ATP-dependent endonuclease of OLD family
MFNLQKISIKKLNNEADVVIPFSDNRLVLVGENGQGKSTIVNLLYFFLTRQWKRMARYAFESITLTINDKTLELGRAELLGFLEVEDEVFSRRNYSSRMAAIFRRMIVEQGPLALEDLNNPAKLRDLARKYGFSSSMVSELRNFIAHRNLSGVQKIPLLTEQIIKELGPTTLLFLPTYRRIEQDLEYVVPSLSRILQEPEQVESSDAPDASAVYVEFARFGMTDVEELLKRRSASVRDRARTRLNNLLGTYLRDMIAERYKEIDSNVLSSLDLDAVTQIVGRVEETMLSADEKQILVDKVRDLKAEKTQPQTRLSAPDKIVLHFLTKLIESAAIQQKEEQQLRAFAAVCNKYLNNKTVRFDDLTLEVLATSTTQPGSPTIDWRLLSSGEKQVISLFAHVFLAEQERLFVIIDEPELSLSVEWQRHFLPDIISSEKCVGIVAVTHSPYIFENDLDKYARSISESIVSAL